MTTATLRPCPDCKTEIPDYWEACVCCQHEAAVRELVELRAEAERLRADKLRMDRLESTTPITRAAIDAALAKPTT